MSRGELRTSLRTAFNWKIFKHEITEIETNLLILTEKRLRKVLDSVCDIDARRERNRVVKETLMKIMKAS